MARRRIADSSIVAYHDVTEKERRDTQMDRIEAFLIASGRARTLAEIADALRIADSTVSARLNAGKKVGRFDTYAKRRCEINPKYRKQTWYIAPPSKQKALFAEAV